MRAIAIACVVVLLAGQSAFGQRSSARSSIISLGEKPAPPLVKEVVHEIDVDGQLPRLANANPNAIAVVIGNSDYRFTKSVKFAVNDAGSMKRYLVDLLGFKEGNVFFLQNASKSDFELYFGVAGNHEGRVYNAVKPGVSEVFVYYSGHGAPGLKDRKGYFVPVECNPNYVELQGYPLDVFYANLGKIRAKSVSVVLDACFSGADLFENISPIVISMETPVFALKNGVAFTSSTRDQASSWYPEKRHGLFTYFFLKAMQEYSLADADKDRRLTYEEIFQYVSDQADGVPYYARRINNIDQMPTLQGDARTSAILSY
jgi:hypothetical protein